MSNRYCINTTGTQVWILNDTIPKVEGDYATIIGVYISIDEVKSLSQHYDGSQISLVSSTSDQCYSTGFYPLPCFAPLWAPKAAENCVVFFGQIPKVLRRPSGTLDSLQNETISKIIYLLDLED